TLISLSRILDRGGLCCRGCPFRNLADCILPGSIRRVSTASRLWKWQCVVVGIAVVRLTLQKSLCHVSSKYPFRESPIRASCRRLRPEATAGDEGLLPRAVRAAIERGAQRRVGK